MPPEIPSVQRVLAGQSPNAAMTNPSRFGLVPVEIVFGVARDRPGQDVVVSGEQVRDGSGKIYFFVASDATGKPVLAKTEAELARMQRSLQRMRSYQETSSTKYGGASPLQVVRDYELERTASVDTYTTTEGKLKFKMDSKEFAQFLASQGIRGSAAGAYLRGEEAISEGTLKLMLGSNKTTNFGYGEGGKYKVQVIGGPRVVAPGQTRRAPLPDIQRVWDALSKEIWKDTAGGGSDAGDMFVNMGNEYEDADFESYLADASGDVSQSYQYALSGPGEELHQKLFEMIKTGEYRGGGYDNWTWRYREQRLRELYADAWHDGMIKGWRKIESNPKELARLKAMRAR